MSGRNHATRAVFAFTCTAPLLFLLAGCGKAADRPDAAAPKVIKTKTGVEMVEVPGGSFVMGRDGGQPEEAPAHRVTVDPFLMDRFEVTQEEYEKHVIGNPSKFKDPKNPVERVRWVEAALYCNARSTAEGFKPCYDEESFACDFSATGYRLPTEAEWECAARAGADGQYCFGGDVSKLGDYAWFRDNASERTHPVGTKRPNTWGLFDLYGNVGEWCQDLFDGQYYATSSEKNPWCAKGGPKRALRGGAWSSGAENCRSARRSGEEPGNFTDACFARPDIGFRCVRRPEGPPAGQKLATTDVPIAPSR